jgi:sugar phosphate permease
VQAPPDESPPAAERALQPKSRLSSWHRATIVLLAAGYSGYYFCRSNLSVVLPQMIEDLAHHGIAPHQAQLRLGFIASAGVVAYAVGKFIAGALADMFGGRRNFLAGMAGSILFVIVFASVGGFPLFTAAWIANRFMQSAGWSGLVKVSSRWFSYSTYGTVMALLSLSYLFGDAACRWVMGQLIAFGLGWRGVFYASAAALGVIFLVNLIFLRETPGERGLPSPQANPLNVYAAAGEAASEHPGMAAILRPLLSSFAFWLVCLLSLGTTVLRETFNLWTPTYFVQAVGLSPAQAASRSALFPLFGGLAVLLAGVVSDRLGLSGRNLVIVFGMTASALCLFGLGSIHSQAHPLIPVILVALTGFLLLGPYSYLAGAMSLDFGGMRGSATASGIIDGVGYLAGYLSGDPVARITVAFGWNGAFRLLAVGALLTALVAVVLLKGQSPARKPG